jgi:hypothetical protein
MAIRRARPGTGISTAPATNPNFLFNQFGTVGRSALRNSNVHSADGYLNGYAALPLVDGLMEQGMAPGAGMAFLVAGGVSSLPAAIAARYTTLLR